MKLQFPLKIENPVFIYNSQQGEFQQVETFAFKVPKIMKPVNEIEDWTFFQISCLESEEVDFESVYSIQLDINNEVHRNSSLKNLMENYEINWTNPFNMNNYDFLFIQENKNLTYIVAFENEEFLVKKLSFILFQLVFQTKYSEIGLRKQVDDALDWICYQSLKKIIQQIGMIHNIEYESMLELTKKVLEINEFYLNNMDIQSIIYKKFISIGLFPYLCELNSMGDDIAKLFVTNLFMGSGVVPWSTKYHACLSFGNVRYSFVNDSLFLAQTVRKKKYKPHWDYISLKILDFFPLNSWIESLGNFFIENFLAMLNYIKTNLPYLKVKRLRKKSKSYQEDESSSFKSLKEPFLLDNELMLQLDEDQEYLRLFKDLIRSSIKEINYEKVFYGINQKISKIIEIKDNITKEFYDNYQSELKRQNNLGHAISIIIETEMKGYSLFTNNCQTPLAAFIYRVCETFRPYQEILKQKKKLKNASLTIRKSVSQLGTEKEDICEADIKWINTYCKYASIQDLAMLAQQFILPASLTHSLDYFGYYSDKLQQEFLDDIRKFNKNIDDFHKSNQHQHNFPFYKQKFCKRKPEDQIKKFENLVNEGIKVGLFSYFNIKMKKLEDALSILQLFSTLDTEKHDDIKFDLHFLMQYYEIQIVNLKKRKKIKKNTQLKHQIQTYLETVYFFYFNSIRLQLSLKERANTLSQIGYVIVKSENKVEREQPSNIDLQIIV
ncbi:unnamed protein product [Paramecium sonneborni]|uniref:Uncharacterized protein n=1 Tax=Paramecium sonneborni TaxID=65129 RepID=A0A8S1RA59_9CILI|nr:unnamed protein product [Paramecium sonneborni]